MKEPLVFEDWQVIYLAFLMIVISIMVGFALHDPGWGIITFLVCVMVAHLISGAAQKIIMAIQKAKD